MLQHQQWVTTFCHALSSCQYHEPLYSAKKLNPFSRFSGDAVETFAAPGENDAKSVTWLKCLWCQSDYHCRQHYIISINCNNFAVLPFLRQCAVIICRAWPIRRKIGNSAEVFSVPFLLEDIISHYTFQKLSLICRFAFLKVKLRNLLPRRADNPQILQCDRILCRNVPTYR